MTNKKRRRSTGGGLGLPMLLFIIFLILKLTNVIDWSWWWVTAPLWISAALVILFFIFIGFILLLALFGLVNQSSRVIVRINKWFRRNEQEDKIDD
ncbi:MAG: hypothetical protein GF308_02470 [Candidatus Heimdallarchaeota archaeon]|nr:hypothetical protein [Candidatus Heimdallarchaeota archaeon]